METTKKPYETPQIESITLDDTPALLAASWPKTLNGDEDNYQDAG